MPDAAPQVARGAVPSRARTSGVSACHVAGASSTLRGLAVRSLRVALREPSWDTIGPEFVPRRRVADSRQIEKNLGGDHVGCVRRITRIQSDRVPRSEPTIIPHPALDCWHVNLATATATPTQ